MPVKKVMLAPGVNRETSRYAAEGGWYETDKVRFREGNPEKIGGWERISVYTYLGVCRSLWNWVTLGGQNLVGVGTNIKFYIERGGQYYDVTPIRSTTAAGDVTFAASNGSSTITVTDTAHGANAGDYVTFSGAVTLGGLITADVLNQEYVIDSATSNTYTITAKDTAGNTVVANASDVGNGGASVVGAYQLNVGTAISVPSGGWGSGSWGEGTWGNGGTSTVALREWSQYNFGEDLFFAPKGGAPYVWDATNGTSTRGVGISTLGGASDTPTTVNFVFVSDKFRFAFAFGCNDLGSGTLDPMLIRWADRESLANWTPAATNEAGSLRLSHGSEIIGAVQARQEIVVVTDAAVYGLQFLGGSEVWGAQLLIDNISIASRNTLIYTGNAVFWMGRDKFYIYDGIARPLPCKLRRYVFSDINMDQWEQCFAGTNEGFNEVWWFYCSSGSTTVDRYVVYNYIDNTWYYGTMARTAWLDSALRDYPVAATYSNNLVYHESGVDDNESGTPAAISAYAISGEFDLDDGDRFMFVRRMLPDVVFTGSTADTPSITVDMYPLKNSGSGYSSPASEGGNSTAAISRSATTPIEAYTGQVYLRLRGRQMVMKVSSSALGVAWQFAPPRLDMRADGRQ